jgi:hypothetical protein
VVGLGWEVLAGRAVQQPTAGRHCPHSVVIPRGTPPGIAELQRVVEEAADALEVLAVAFQQDAECPGV